MLQMPPIQRRLIDKIKGTRAIRIERTAPAHPVGEEPSRSAPSEAHAAIDRRKEDRPVAKDRRKRRRTPRRLANPEIKALLENTGTPEAPVQGRFIDESV